MEKVILIRFNEIHLKGGNKKYFLNLLYNNIKEAIKDFDCKLENIQNRLIVRGYNDSEEQDIIDALTSVFGVHSISVATEINSDEIEIKDFVSKLKINSSFKCDVNRADKSFPIKSNDFAGDLGEIVLKNNESARVDIHNPEKIISVDIRENGKTFIFTDTIHAYSGLPLGEKADGLLLLSGGIDSPVAGFCMAKRGLRQDVLHFDSFPYTSPQAKEKVITLAKKIKMFIGAKYMYICSITKLQEEFHIHCSSEYAINLLRRSMIRVANYLCEKYKYKTIVTGESLGQVASQTIESLNSTNSVAKNIVLRPLISFNKEEIIDIAKKIGTYETSILPYEDCCTVFLPRNPVIKPRIKDAEKEESKINLDYILNEIVQNIEVIEL